MICSWGANLRAPQGDGKTRQVPIQRAIERVPGGYIDLSFTCDFGDKAQIYAGVNNVFATDPPIVAGFGGYGNAFPATYDHAGMTVFPGVTVNAFRW